MTAVLARPWEGRRVLVTGASGFKGAWLSAWLQQLGAEVWGLGLAPESADDLFAAARLDRLIHWQEADIRDPATCRQAVEAARPHLVLHLAAQALVRPSYQDPLGTFATNVMGTAHLLDALRLAKQPCGVVIVTTDKCYRTGGAEVSYREADAMGGDDPYSASKGCAELVTHSYRTSFFPLARLADHGVAVASARAGNVIGPGDWATDRLVPDCVRSLREDQPIHIRKPHAIRPWQHVLEPLAGYLELADRLHPDRTLSLRRHAAQGWNFGPRPEDAVPVGALVESLIGAWGTGRWVDGSSPADPPESASLRLCIDRALTQLSWPPRWSFSQTIDATVAGYRALETAGTPAEVLAVMTDQIARYGSVPTPSEVTA